MRLPVQVIAVLAWRNLWRNYRRTSIMLMAVVLGVWAMVFMNAMMTGMIDGMVQSGIRNLPGHAQLHNPAYRDDPSVENSMAEPSGALRDALDNPAIVGWSARVLGGVKYRRHRLFGPTAQLEAGADGIAGTVRAQVTLQLGVEWSRPFRDGADDAEGTE